jgi:4-amino-4-deoxy-L-arabinose transferase-like glycosyltransferase
MQGRPASEAAAAPMRGARPSSLDGGGRTSARSREWLAWGAVALITLAAGALRLYRIDGVALDPFYDSAVRSMSLSLHNFFLGAMEPGGGVSIDKPPVDLWLQVISTKLFGFNTTGLMLPEALIGTATVPLLFAAVRRIWNVRAGLAAALVLAFLPIEVITSRSDTMDAVMMALIVLAMLGIARAAQSDSTAWLMAAAAALGLAFDVKLTESMLALPGLALFALFALPGPLGRRIVRLLAAGALYVLIALAWLLATLAFPASERPYAYGSDDGSAWDAALVFNGLDRIEGKPGPGQSAEPYNQPGLPKPSQYASLTLREREDFPLRAPAPGRLLDRVGPLNGARLGFILLAALLLGLPALISELLRWRRERTRPGGAGGAVPPGDGALASTQAGPAAREEALAARRASIRRAGLAGLVLWVLIGTVLFSQMVHLHPRYTEGFAPAVAAMLGIGLAWVTERASAIRAAALALALVVLAIYGEQLLFGASTVWWVLAACALGAIGAALAAALSPAARGKAGAPGGLRAAALALALASVLAIPVWAAVRAVEDNASDTNRLGVLAQSVLRPLSSYLRAHQGSAYYETVYDSASKMGELVVHDARPVLVLNTANSAVVTPLSRLKREIARGRVRYAVINDICGPRVSRENSDCSIAARWIVAHGRNISAQAGLPKPTLLWLLPHVQAATARASGRALASATAP